MLMMVLTEKQGRDAYNILLDSLTLFETSKVS